MTRHAIIIRFWHNNSAHFEWRFNHFKNEVLPRLQKQTVEDFHICMLMKPEHQKQLIDLDHRIRPFLIESPSYDYNYKKEGNFNHDRTVLLKKYPIQTRMDSDDYVKPEFLELIEDKHRELRQGLDEENKKTLVTFQPWKVILETNETRKLNHRFSDSKPSMFMSIQQDDMGESYTGVYKKVFHRFASWAHATYCVPEERKMCAMVIHDLNTGSHKGT